MQGPCRPAPSSASSQFRRLVYLFQLSAVALIADDAILLRVPAGNVLGGRSSFVAEVQHQINGLPTECRPTPLLIVDGQFGKASRAALTKAATCPGFQAALPVDSPARQGALTEALWKLLFTGRDIPTVHERAMVIVLTNEETDYDQAEWNFCQSRPPFNPGGGQPDCFSNDPKSYLTWGPRGATAGHGAEIQQIVYAIDENAATSALVDGAFGALAPQVRRLNRLSESDVERFLCAVWLNPQSRSDWKEGFRRFGSNTEVRRAYDIVYGAAEFDGSKIERYYRLYLGAGIVPTQIDYAFFVDRATHMSAPTEEIIRRARAEVAGATPAQLRRWLALNHRPPNQRTDRLGRDVVFYVGALESILTPEEHAAWKQRNPLRASDFGLSDSLKQPEFHASPIPFPRPTTDMVHSLTPEERNRCPAAVLSPKAPAP